eukprot:m.637890 g.637890  ORF g.637890 m.637890 type:complete len:337 (-) comp58323_c0_seq2:113-1123(-)
MFLSCFLGSLCVSFCCANPQAGNKAAVSVFESAWVLVRTAALISSNDIYTELQTSTLRLVLVPVYVGSVVSQSNAGVDDPRRDTIRLHLITQAISYFKEFLELCIALDFDQVDSKWMEKAVKQQPGERRDRDTKVQASRQMSALDKHLTEMKGKIDEYLAQKRQDLDEDALRDYHIKNIQFWCLKAMDQIEVLGNEFQLVEQMIAARASSERMETPQQARTNHIQSCAHSHQPFVLTKDKVLEMAMTNATIDRCNFKLVTKGHGPIGAPTMTLDQAYDMEVAMGKIPANGAQAPAQVEEPDSDDEEVSEENTYRARAMDEYKDHNRRGDGNRMGKG